jgi:hypothetical protein
MCSLLLTSILPIYSPLPSCYLYFTTPTKALRDSFQYTIMRFSSTIKRLVALVPIAMAFLVRVKERRLIQSKYERLPINWKTNLVKIMTVDSHGRKRKYLIIRDEKG